MIEKTHRGLNKGEYIYINLYEIGYGANIYLQKSQAYFICNIVKKVISKYSVMYSRIYQSIIKVFINL